MNPPAPAPLLDVTCQRCGGGFECGVNAGHCDCFGIRLTDALRAELAARYDRCLCLRCLRELVAASTTPS
ncbi:cysteine-rich CWC family protein [Roseateles sp.]|uniref:cysteine-rich CWC family protein n=1 Tax=Roseateles sp. TaxID=1971397 RepID=UPI0025F49EF4|nr:cysteine-rich CWC family protein [Roseateles sp.]MBV8033633.1 cysteine-rich CWC family protein [Roseateles sp.]